MMDVKYKYEVLVITKEGLEFKVWYDSHESAERTRHLLMSLGIRSTMMKKQLK